MHRTQCRSRAFKEKLRARRNDLDGKKREEKWGESEAREEARFTEYYSPIELHPESAARKGSNDSRNGGYLPRK